MYGATFVFTANDVGADAANRTKAALRDFFSEFPFQGTVSPGPEVVSCFDGLVITINLAVENNREFDMLRQALRRCAIQHGLHVGSGNHSVAVRVPESGRARQHRRRWWQFWE